MLILLSLLLAYKLPFEGLFLSYAILGPLHYLTQISWLHDRRYYFTDTEPRRFFVAAVIILTVWLSMPAEAPPLLQPSNYAFSFVVLSLFVMPLFLNVQGRRRLPLLLLLPLLVWALLHIDFFLLLGLTLLPSFVHVAVFTFTFLLLGARRSKSPASIISVCVWLLSALLVFFNPPDNYVHSLAWFSEHRIYFDSAALAIGAAEHHPADSSWAAAYGLLTFAFTYHYLNWFSKTELLKWHKIPRKRGLAILGLYLAALTLYLYNYVLGLQVLLFLSFLHVFLEFPLNLQTIRALLSLKKDGEATRP